MLFAKMVFPITDKRFSDFTVGRIFEDAVQVFIYQV